VKPPQGELLSVLGALGVFQVQGDVLVPHVVRRIRVKTEHIVARAFSIDRTMILSLHAPLHIPHQREAALLAVVLVSGQVHDNRGPYLGGETIRYVRIYPGRPVAGHPPGLPDVLLHKLIGQPSIARTTPAGAPGVDYLEGPYTTEIVVVPHYGHSVESPVAAWIGRWHDWYGTACIIKLGVHWEADDEGIVVEQPLLQGS